MATYLKNTTYIDWETFEFRNADILVNDGIDEEIQFLESGSPEPDDVTAIDCQGLFVTKSFACGHHHSYSALGLGMPSPKEEPTNFMEILKNIWWRLDKSLDLEMVKSSALITAINCAKNGVTFVTDHHSSPLAINGSLEIIAKAFESVGISHLLCYEITDRNEPEKTEMSFEETARHLANHQALVGLHASFTVNNESFRKAVDLVEKFDSGIHMHVAEDKCDQKITLETYNKTVVERLQEFGVLESRKAILAHCIHLNDAERSLIENSNVWVVQNTISNLNNNVGMFNSIGLGNKILLGTDGIHSDMIRAAKMAYFIGHAFDKIDLLKIYRRFRNLHKYNYINDFNGDGENNLVVLDYQPSTDFNQENFLGHFLFGLESKHIKHVISNGKLIVNDRHLLTIDEVQIMEESKVLSEKLWARMQS